MTHKLRVAVIGAGKWATMAHFPALLASGRTTVVGVFDQDAVRAEQASIRFGIPRVYRTLEEAVSDQRVDLVDVCTSNAGHYPAALAAIEAGKHVLCEKPIGLNLAEAYSLYEHARTRGVYSAVGFTFRYAPAVRLFRELLAQGTVGRVYHVQGFEQNSLYHDPLEPKPPNWLRQESDVGALGGYASHLVDLVRWTVGEFLEVVGDLQNYVSMRAVVGGGMMPANVDDSAVFLGRLDGDVQGVFQASWLAAGRPPGVELRVFGDRGALKVWLAEHPDGNERLLHADIEEGIFRPVAIPAELGASPVMEEWPTTYFTNLVESVASAIQAGREPEGGFVDGWRCQQILDAVALSSRERRWVTVASVAPEPREVG